MCHTVNKEVTYSTGKRSGRNRTWAVLATCTLLLILAGLGYLAVYRPVIVMDSDHERVQVRNSGGTVALIYRVDGFWYWGGQVALVSNMPGIHQRIASGAGPVTLEIPKMPPPDERIAQQGPFYMKLVLRYGIPGIPIFRFTTPLYFHYDAVGKTWKAEDHIPPEYRALGNVPIGNIDFVEVSF